LSGWDKGITVASYVNLLKLCVGAEGVEDLINWQDSHRAAWAGGRPVHVTRMWPKRAEEILNGGSLYWVFKGVVLARQRSLGLEERLGGDGITRCALVLDPEVIRTEAAPRRPFQGWRDLGQDEAPRDLPRGRAREEALPVSLAQALAEIGLR
jgi:hypothetical protein